MRNKNRSKHALHADTPTPAVGNADKRFSRNQNRAFTYMAIWMGLGCTIVFSAALWLAWFFELRPVYLHDQLAQHGVTTEAVIIEHVSQTNYTPNSTQSTVYEVTYQFAVPSTDKTYTRTLDVNSDVWNRIPEGTRVQIAYAPDDPTISQLVEGEARTANWYQWFIALFIGLFGIAAASGLATFVYGLWMALQKQH